MLTDNHYLGLPWKDGGRDRDGLDCAGLAHLWLREQLSFPAACPCSDAVHAPDAPYHFTPLGPEPPPRGHALFLRWQRKGPEPRHVAVSLGDGRYLHILQGMESRIDRGTTLMERLGLEPLGTLSPDQAEELCAALNNPKIGLSVGEVILLVIAIVAMAVSYALRPSQSGFRSKRGQYSQDALITQKDTELPLPDVLGSVVVAGNSVYQQLPDHSATSSGTGAKWNTVIILASAPANLIDYQTGFYLKGISWQDKVWKDGANVDGIFANPDQTKDEAVTGSINGDSNVPSVTFYDGAYDVAVPIDIRASYDRDFPLYRFAGCSYFVLRAIDATKFSGLNFTTRVQGRVCRTFDASGFITDTFLMIKTGDGTTVRFLAAHPDLASITVATVSLTGYTEISATNQAGNIYSLNRTKGYVEFITAPAAASSISVSGTYYVSAWTQNPAAQLVYLLTDTVRGKGIDPARIDWNAAVAFRDYCDEVITYTGPNGTVTGPRFQTDYALDDRKPFQDHLQAILDACNGSLILSNGKYILRQRVGSSSVFSFDTSNILLDPDGRSTFQPELLDRSAKPNRIKLLYSSQQSLNAEDEAIADDEDNQRARAARVGNNGIVEENLKLPAVTDPNQAQRLAGQYLAEQTQSNFLYIWKTSVKGLALQPGDLVDVTHPILPGAPTQFRIETLSHDPDDHLEITASQYVPSAYL